MKLVRYQDAAGTIHYGNEHTDGRMTRLEGDIFSETTDTGQDAEVSKRLAPVEPRDILCIGLNYRKHAIEGNQPIPENPIVFMKNSGALQHPGDPIVLPRKLRSDKVDYECELAVIIGKPCHYVSKADALFYVM
ncbi:MAG: fumarylacetoacetate hydrolase family protein [Planctomycetota bacterium]|nr:fumarylacetoacetate hydrolase family protein [Planctomycetota bacterium]